MKLTLLISLIASALVSCSKVSVKTTDGQDRQVNASANDTTPIQSPENIATANDTGTTVAINKDTSCQQPGQYDHPGQADDTCGQEPVEPMAQILEINANGPGCAADTVSVNISEDAEAFTLVFADFYIELPQLDPEVQIANKQCLIELKLHVRSGYRFKVSRIDFRGYMSLDADVLASLSSRYRFLERADSYFYFNHNFTGPRDDSFFIEDLGQDEPAFWSPCSDSGIVTLQIDSAMKLVDQSIDKNQFAYLSVDSADGDFGQDIHLNWDHCR
jgi:hypothetical protein